ncbi:oxidized purine nucleoside triphosphate hydrolase-like [Leguminivora glycinivorella]|uniref:oxidized purine nucleoside triphosphate hydrolase-like n=1 Tax=Leguminivora glycinivorella TaxID=1035111 RepID=UPI00200C5AE2|nr:oxidized purine nucleoside triphosphate hydrolase-like [Leguminivora glycinivorella]
MLLKKLFTIVFVRTDTQVLLGLKKRGFGVNKWNGFGGKVEPNETIVEAAVRELKEECCLIVKKSDMKNIGHLEFTFEGESTMMDVRVFSTTVYEGTPTETEEMLPKWYNNDEIPYKDMWLDDAIWYPYMLKGKLFYGKFHYQGHEKIINYNVEELQSMEDFYANRK